MNKENGYKGQIARLKNENQKLKSDLEKLGLEILPDAINESEAQSSIRSLKRFMERLIAPINKEEVKIKNPELAAFINQTLAAIDFAGEVA
jgi:cob(I)alamin adenosyltransferase